MDDFLTRLYPPDGARFGLAELALEQRLLQHGAAGRPWLYSSFIMSLNGAAAVADGADRWVHPAALSDPRDLQLLCGLMAQADCLITNSGYLRDLHRGMLGDLLRLPERPQYRTLLDYRARRHAGAAPDILVVSRSLDFPLPASCTPRGQTLRVLTGPQAPAARIAALRDAGVAVQVTADPDWISADSVYAAVRESGARTAYLFCGPRTNALLLEAGYLRRVYLSWRHLLHGGQPVLTPGSGLPEACVVPLRLQELYQADARGALPGLWFGCFDAP